MEPSSASVAKPVMDIKPPQAVSTEPAMPAMAVPPLERADPAEVTPAQTDTGKAKPIAAKKQLVKKAPSVSASDAPLVVAVVATTVITVALAGMATFAYLKTTGSL